MHLFVFLGLSVTLRKGPLSIHRAASLGMRGTFLIAKPKRDITLIDPATKSGNDVPAPMCAYQAHVALHWNE